MLSSSPSSSMSSSSTSDLCEKPVIHTTHSTVASPPHRPKRPRYVSFVSPEFISPQLDRRRSWVHRWPLLIIRIFILVVTTLLIDSSVKFTNACGPNGSATLVTACAIASFIVSFVYILSWVWGRIRQCKTIGAYGSSGSVVDPEANESSPLVSRVSKKQSRKVIHLTIHAVFFLMWSVAIANWIAHKTESGSILIYTDDYSDIEGRCPILPETSVHLTFVGLALWTMASLFIWIDIRRREF